MTSPAASQPNVPKLLRLFTIMALASVAVVSSIGFYATMSGKSHLGDVNRLLDVVRSADSADMAHDAIHANVLGVLAAANDAEWAPYVESLPEDIKTLTDNVVDNEAFDAVPEVKAAADAAKDDVAAYVATAEAIVNGKLSDTEVAQAKAELHTVFETLKASLEKVSESVDAAAEETTASAESTAKFAMVALVLLGLGAFAAAFVASRRITKKITEPLAEIAEFLAPTSKELTDVSQQVSAAATETAAQAQTVSAASDQVSTSVTTVAAVVDELNAAISEIASQAHTAAAVAGRAVSVSESAGQVIDRLGQSSNEIGKVVELISSIADETSLLALNATIEAARAGDSGKGFAVVASEVKGLAQGSAEATEGIRAKIDAIRSDAAAAAVALSDIAAIITQINDIQGTIASAVEEQTAATNEMAASVAHVSQGAALITANISDVASASVQTSESIVATHTSAARLAEIADRLESLIR